MSGIFRLPGRLFRRAKALAANLYEPPALSLLYHRVAEPGCDPEMLSVSPEAFDAQLSFLKEHFQILRFEDAWGRLGRPSAAITFDDGYSDNLRTALPLLERHSIPAAFFISPGYIGDSRGFWWDRLAILLEGSSKKQLAPFVFGGRDYRFSSDAEAACSYRALQRLLKGLLPVARERLLDALSAWSGKSGHAPSGAAPLDEAGLRALAASPLATLGSHTLSHVQLSALDGKAQLEEIAGGHRLLEELAAVKAKIFSFPFGTEADYNGESVRICRELGFAKAASCLPGSVHSWSDPLQVPRIIVRNWTLDEFAGKIRMARWIR